MDETAGRPNEDAPGSLPAGSRPPMEAGAWAQLKLQELGTTTRLRSPSEDSWDLHDMIP